MYLNFTIFCSMTLRKNTTRSQFSRFFKKSFAIIILKLQAYVRIILLLLIWELSLLEIWFLGSIDLSFNEYSKLHLEVNNTFWCKYLLILVGIGVTFACDDIIFNVILEKRMPLIWKINELPMTFKQRFS